MSKQPTAPLSKGSAAPARLPALSPSRNAGGVSPQERTLSPQPGTTSPGLSPGRHLSAEPHSSPSGGSNFVHAHPKLEPLHVSPHHPASTSSKDKSPTQSKGTELAPIDEGKPSQLNSAGASSPGEYPTPNTQIVPATVEPIPSLPLPPTLSPAEIAEMQRLFKASDMYLVTQSPSEGVSTRVSIRASGAVVSPSRMHALMQVNIYNSYDREGTTHWTPHIVFRRYPKLAIVHDQWGSRYEMNEWGRGGQYGKTGIQWASPPTDGKAKASHGHDELPGLKEKAPEGEGGQTLPANDSSAFVMPLFDRLEAIDHDA
jgi:hypothetical protein